MMANRFKCKALRMGYRTWYVMWVLSTPLNVLFPTPNKALGNLIGQGKASNVQGPGIRVRLYTDKLRAGYPFGKVIFTTSQGCYKEHERLIMVFLEPANHSTCRGQAGDVSETRGGCGMTEPCLGRCHLSSIPTCCHSGQPFPNCDFGTKSEKWGIWTSMRNILISI